MTKIRHSDTELREASDHLHYEITMLHGTMLLLATGALGQSVLSNALIESVTIHARVLIHFLYPTNPYQTDVLAEDFFERGEWGKIRPNEPEVFSAVRGRVNKEVAHLTYDRQLVTPELKAWDVVTLGNAILGSIKRFRKAVPQELLGSRWPKAKSENDEAGVEPKLPFSDDFVTDVSTPGNV